MSDIIEQLEAGKKIQEEEGIDIASLRTKVSSNEEEEIKEKPKNKKKKEQLKDKNIKEDPFVQAEKIVNNSSDTNDNEIEKPKNKKQEKFPGFDFNNYYEKGQKIFYIRVHKKLGIKDFLELKIRTIYPKMMVACEEKRATVCIGPDTKDLIFTDRRSATQAYDNIEIKDFKDINIKDELGDTEIQDMED